MHEYQSQDTTKLAAALMQVQRDLQPAIKDATNPFYPKSLCDLQLRYGDLPGSAGRQRHLAVPVPCAG